MECSYWTSGRHPWPELVGGCREAEALGWDGVWVPDHLMPPAAGYADSVGGELDPELGPLHEAWTALAAIAATVPRVRVGTLVTANTRRHPPLVAKMAVTVDHISGGRCVLGLGAGWQENEHRRYGIDLPKRAERLDRLAEACQVVRLLLERRRADFAGRYYRLDAAPLEPKPLQSPLPLVIGGGGPGALAIAARYGDGWNAWGTPVTLREKGEQLDRECARVGRDPADIRRSANAMVLVCDNAAEAERARRGPRGRPVLAGTVEQLTDLLGAYRDAGVDEFVAPDFHLADPGLRRQLRAGVVEALRPLRRG